MSRTLIIPDLHSRTHIAEFLIKNEKPDLCVFLGDYFDSWNDDCNPDLVRKTAKWFSWSINQPNRVHLAGNHDCSYWFPSNKHLWCPGFNHIKLLLIQEYVTPKDFEKLKFHYNLDNKWILSHAGVHPQWLGSHNSSPKRIDDFLKKETKEFLSLSRKGKKHWFSYWSRARSGTAHPGGLLWNDFSGDFNAIIGVNQIVGHSIGDIPRWISYINGDDRQRWYDKSYEMNVVYNSKNSFNLCLDTQSQHYAIWDGQILEVNSTQLLVIQSD